MSSASYPPVLPAPTLPRAVPCFRLRELEPQTPHPAKQVWDERCTRILRSGPNRSNAEVARLIEATTGMRFGASVITRHRRALGLPRPRHNEWTSALRRWKPWQGGSTERS